MSLYFGQKAVGYSITMFGETFMAPINFDKTTCQKTWFRDDIEEVVKNAVSKLCIALQKTPIYASNERKKGVELVSDAEVRIKRRLSHLPNLVVNSEKLLRDIDSRISSKDRADLIVTFSIGVQEWRVVVEYDAARADQVAKKFVSRLAQMPRENLIYIACCYSGTKRMSLPEVTKYFTFMSIICEYLQIAGFIGMAPPKNRG